MLPTESNFVGNVFGGALLAEVDRVAYISARRHSGRNCVTASIDRVDFLAPVHVGEVVEFEGQITFVGRTSMEVGVRIRAEPVVAGPRRLVGNAFVTMVALDAAGRPVPVPPLRLESEEDRRRFAEGRARRDARLSARAGSPARASEAPKIRSRDEQ